jgi:hypothetical protein
MANLTFDAPISKPVSVLVNNTSNKQFTIQVEVAIIDGTYTTELAANYTIGNARPGSIPTGAGHYIAATTGLSAATAINGLSSGSISGTIVTPVTEKSNYASQVFIYVSNVLVAYAVGKSSGTVDIITISITPKFTFGDITWS